jgi:hypothetical protein
MTFQLSLAKGARLRLIEIDGVLCAVLKFRAQQKRHQSPSDKTSELSSGMEMHLRNYKDALMLTRNLIDHATMIGEKSKCSMHKRPGNIGIRRKEV